MSARAVDWGEELRDAVGVYNAELRRAVDRVQEGSGGWESMPLVAVRCSNGVGRWQLGLEGERCSGVSCGQLGPMASMVSARES